MNEAVPATLPLVTASFSLGLVNVGHVCHWRALYTCPRAPWLFTSALTQGEDILRGAICAVLLYLFRLITLDLRKLEVIIMALVGF
jgi:hypothetical protein